MTAHRRIEPSEAQYVLDNLRHSSAEEIAALGLDPRALKHQISRQEISWCVYADSHPAALLGALPIRRGVWSLFGFGTEGWTSVWRLVTVIARRDMMQAVRLTGAHRAQCPSPAAHTDTHRWLRFLGASHEAALPAYGANEEDFIMFSWLRESGNVWA